MSSSEIAAVVAVVLLVGLAAVLAAAETSLTHLPRARVQALADEDRKGADALLRMLDRRERVLNPVLFVVLLCHLVAASLVTLLAQRFLGPLGIFAAVAVEVAVIFVLAEAAPGLDPPDSVRQDGDEPRVIAVESEQLFARVAEVALEERDAVDPGSVAIIVPQTLVDKVAAALDEAGIEFGRAARNGLETQVTLVPVSLVKGLELDAAVVVEPAAIVDEEAQGMRALYVALTRATKRLALVHAAPLPEVLRATESSPSPTSASSAPSESSSV